MSANVWIRLWGFISKDKIQDELEPQEQFLKKSVEPGLTKYGGWGRSSVLSAAFTSESSPKKTDGSTVKIKSAVLSQDPLRSEKT